MTNIRLAFCRLMPLFAVLLAPMDAWEASTSQNLSITVTPNAPANAFYVATSGSDSNPGTLASPFKTLQKCQTAMQNSPTVKTCYIRGGTYTGSGVGWNAQTTTSAGGWVVNEAVYLTSADNGETFSYYPGDGYNTAIFDGGAGTWSAASGAASGCTQNASPTTAMGRGFYLQSTTNVTIDGLTFRNFCYGGIGLHADNTDWAQVCMPGTGANSTGNIIRNNIIYNITDHSTQCGGDVVGYNRALHVNGNVENTTISHNFVYNTTGGGVAVDNKTLNGNISNLMLDHNLVVNTNLLYNDNGAIYIQDIGSNCNPTCQNAEVSTNLRIQYNYVLGWGVYGNGAALGMNTQAYYNDDGTSNSTRLGNIAVGHGAVCFFQHAGGNNITNGNMCDIGNVSAALGSGATVDAIGWLYVSSSQVPTFGSVTHQHDMVIANTPSCWFSGGTPTWCVLQENDANAPGGYYQIGNNNYWNYDTAGNSVLNNAATAQGDGSPNNVNPQFVQCPSNGQDSWGYVIGNAPGTGVFASPVSFPAQPSGWATPGFWGPPVGPNWNGKIPHSLPPSFVATPPSYGPTC